MEDRIDFQTFRRLLQSLENSDTSIRLRMSGEGWMESSRLVLLSESAMIVEVRAARKVVMNLRNVVEFEIDEPTDGLRVNYTYEVGY